MRLRLAAGRIVFMSHPHVARFAQGHVSVGQRRPGNRGFRAAPYRSGQPQRQVAEAAPFGIGAPQHLLGLALHLFGARQFLLREAPVFLVQSEHAFPDGPHAVPVGIPSPR